MLVFLRHLLAFLALPFVVTVVVPCTWFRPTDSWADRLPLPERIALQGLGALCLLVGLSLFAASLHLFATRGRGTLAPWDPPEHLVVGGPYRFVRNPMISGVLFVLLAEALLFLSPRLLVWTGTFLLMNVVYIPLLEEPALRARFGAPYDEYTRHVRRFLPRTTPWTPAGPSG